jgi:hypothetical protein
MNELCIAFEIDGVNFVLRVPYTDAGQEYMAAEYMAAFLTALHFPPRPLGTPISQLSGRPGHPGYDEFRRISSSWGYD